MKTPRLGCSTFLGQLRVAWDRACVGRVGQRFFFFLLYQVMVDGGLSVPSHPEGVEEVHEAACGELPVETARTCFLWEWC